MPSTYTLNNGIELIGTGEQSGTWGDTTNTNLDLLDAALDGQVTITLGAAGSSGSPNALPITDGTASNGRNRMVVFADGGDLGATAYVQLTPNDAEKIIYIRNSLSGSRSVILFQGTYNASNDYEVPAGTTAIVYFDGAGAGAVAANVFNNAHFDAINVVGTVTATTVEFDNLSGTGAVSVTNILDEDNMASDSATALATQQSIKAYVDAQVDTVDTLAEILAIGNTTGATDIAVDSAQKVQFRDAAIYINSSVDGQLDIVADTEIQIGTTLVDLNGNLNVSGTTIVTGVLTTTAATVFNGGITMPDSGVAKFGTGSDLQIYHDAANSYIEDSGTGSLFIRGTSLILEDAGGNDYIAMTDTGTGGTVELKHNAVTKLATTATGIDVTGTVTATGTSVFASLDISGDIDVDGTTNLDVVDIDGATQIDATVTVGVDDTGYDVKFFGATAGAYMLWDESADDLILGGAAGLSVNSTALVTGVLTTTAATVFNGGFTANAASTITTADNLDTLSLTSTDADADVAPNLRMYRNSGSPADNDQLGKIQFEGRNDNSEDVIYSEIINQIKDASDGTEDGRMALNSMVAGTLRARLDILPTETVFNDGSIDLDFRVESATTANALFVEGSSGNVGIGTSSPLTTLHVNSTYGTGYTGAFSGVSSYNPTSSEMLIGTFLGSAASAGDYTGLRFNISGNGSGVASAGIIASREAAEGNGNTSLSFLTRTTTSSLTERMNITSAGNVNITGGNLDVVGQVTATGGAAAAPTYSFIGDTDTGISRPTTNAVNIVTAGTERLRIDSSGGLITKPAAGGHAVFNEDGIDADFRVESDGQTHALFVDAADDFVGINTSDTSYGHVTIVPGGTVNSNIVQSPNATWQLLALRRTSVSSTVNNTTVDVLRFFKRDGSTIMATSHSSGSVYICVRGGSATNQGNYHYSLQHNGLGATGATFTLVSSSSRGTNPVSSIGVVDDGAGGGIKVQVTYINNSGVVNSGQCRVLFDGLISPA
jgi:hypothetical protein